MNTERESEWVRAVNDSLLDAHSRSMTNDLILMEVVRVIAEQADNPNGVLSKMFERVSARLDQFPVEHETRSIVVETRNTISLFFSKAASAFR